MLGLVLPCQTFISIIHVKFLSICTLPVCLKSTSMHSQLNIEIVGKYSASTGEHPTTSWYHLRIRFVLSEDLFIIIVRIVTVESGIPYSGSCLFHGSLPCCHYIFIFTLSVTVHVYQRASLGVL